ncbi:MAG: cache domain-containing protein, partial [Candidatus Caldatribacteriaceae bacterium]
MGLSSSTTMSPPEGYDPRIRPWYQAALEAYPAISGGIPYTEIKTGEWLVSMSKVLLSDQGEIAGVISVETPLEPLAAVLREGAGNYRSLYGYVTRSDGKILIHHRESFRGQRLQDMTGSSISFEKESGRLTYSLDGVGKIAYYHRIAPLDWVVVTVVERREILVLIVRQILRVIALVSVVALFLGWILSGILSSEVIAPILQLKERVEGILREVPREEESPEYPKNEIGAILLRIE